MTIEFTPPAGPFHQQLVLRDGKEIAKIRKHPAKGFIFLTTNWRKRVDSLNTCLNLAEAMP